MNVNKHGKSLKLFGFCLCAVVLMAYGIVWGVAQGRDLTYDEQITGDSAGVNGAVSYVHDLVGNRITSASTLPGVVSQSNSYSVNDRLDSDTCDDNGNTVAAAGITARDAYDAFGIHLYEAGAGTPNFFRYTGEQFDADLGQYYLRARYYEPTRGRFWTQDSYEGSPSDPISLHKYLYANASPVMYADPSGKMSMIETSIVNAQIAVLNAVRNVGLGFMASAAAGGRALYSLGYVVQAEAASILQYLNVAIPIQTRGQIVFGPGGRRVIDLLAQAGTRIAWIECKYKLPSRAGDTLTRLVGQMQSAVASAGQNAQVVLFTFKEQSAKELELVLSSLGDSGLYVQFVSGFSGLVRWAQFYFGPGGG